MAFRHPFFELDPFENVFFSTPQTDTKAVVSFNSKSDSTIFPRYRAMNDNDAMVLEIELPGVDKSSIELDISRKQLAVAAKRSLATSFGAKRTMNNENDVAHEHKDIQNGGTNASPTARNATEEGVGTGAKYLNYAAKFRLGYEVDVDRVQAEYKEGVLRVRVPRHEEAARRVTIAC